MKYKGGPEGKKFGRQKILSDCPMAAKLLIDKQINVNI